MTSSLKVALSSLALFAAIVQAGCQGPRTAIRGPSLSVPLPGKPKVCDRKTLVKLRFWRVQVKHTKGPKPRAAPDLVGQWVVNDRWVRCWMAQAEARKATLRAAERGILRTRDAYEKALQEQGGYYRDRVRSVRKFWVFVGGTATAVGIVAGVAAGLLLSR